MLLSGCSLFQESNRRRELRETLNAGQTLFVQGDYSGSQKAFQSVIALAQDQPPADVATYHLGLIYVSPKNPNRDRHKALGLFDRLIAQYPDSRWTEEAKIWVGVLNEAEESTQEIEKSKQVIEKSRDDLEQTRLAAEKSKQEIDKSRLELERSKQEIEKIKQLLEKSKQVDIEIEQKRRGRGR